MRIRILGTRGMIPLSAPRHRNHSGVLVDDVLLFDLGERTFLRRAPKAVFITHLHPDHAAFVAEPFAVPMPVYAPERGGFSFISVAKPVRIAGWRITPVPTEHSKRVKSCAYLIEKGRTRVLYTGDLFWMTRAARDTLGRLSAVITEGSFMQEGGAVRTGPRGERWGHAGIPNLVRMFRTHTDTIVLTHFGSWFFRDIPAARKRIAALGTRYGVRLVVAYDGMEMTV